MEVKDISIHYVAEVCSWNSNRTSYSAGFKDSWMQDSSCSVCYGCGSQFNIYNCCCSCHIFEDTFCGYYSQEKFTADGCSRFQTGNPLHLCKIFHSQGDQDFTYFNAGKISQRTALFSSIYSLSSISTTGSSLKKLPEYPLLGLTGFQLPSWEVGMDTKLEQKKLMPGRKNIRILSPKGREGSPSPYDFCNDSRSYEDDDECLREAVFYSPRYQRKLEEDAGEDGSALLGSFASDGTKVNLEKCETVSQCFDQRSELSAGYSEEPEEGLEENSFYASVYKEPPDLKEKDLPLDIENNAMLWAAPPPESEEDEFGTSGEDDDDDSERWSLYSSLGSSSNSKYRSKESSAFELRKDMRAVVNGHFRLVVGQLLSREGLQEDEGGPESWLEIVTALSLEAASVVKPDTSIGGGMDPGAYVKINCVASGQPTESQVVRGIVCKKNVAHKRMTTRVKASRLLLLGGSLELHSVSNHLSSLDTLLQQETDHLSLAVSRIEAHHPNVLLVEKTVSRQAQERLLAKGISLVLNIKRALLERIARCTGATIASSLEHLASAKVGHCELFHVEKYCEEHGCAGQGGKKLRKTLMYFEGCPKPFGCSILLKGANAGELKKVKRAVKLAVFAAYHLALETSFLADEGVELCLTSPLSVAPPAKSNLSISPLSSFSPSASSQAKNHPVSLGSPSISSTVLDSTTDHGISILREASPGTSPFKGGGDSNGVDSVMPFTSSKTLGLQEAIGVTLGKLSAALALEDLGQGVLNFTASVREALSGEKGSESSPTTNIKHFDDDELVSMEKNTGPPVSEDLQIQMLSVSSGKMDSNSLAFGAHSSSQTSNGDYDTEDPSREEFPPSPSNHQSILVSFSSSCLRKGTICERGHLFRIKYYGTFDKPLGRFLRETLFDLTQKCPACGESKDAHVDCYTHRQGCLTISVHKQSQSLSGESEGKIWMWHRCLRCNRVDGIPLATRRLVMSDAAWGLSFGKFLELSFSNHAAASKVASCGHSLHRDCLRFYGFGNMTACIRYSPVNVYSVYLPPSKLDFHCVEHQEWLEQEIREIAEKGDHLFKDIFIRLQQVYDKITNVDGKSQEAKSYILELKDIVTKQEDSFKRALHDAASFRGADQPHADILQLNYIRRSLSKCSSLWENRIQNLSSSLKSPRSFPGFDSTLIGDTILSFLKEISFGSGRNRKSDVSKEPSVAGSLKSESIKLDLSPGSGQFLLENSKPIEGLVCGNNADDRTKESELAKIGADEPCIAKPVDLASSGEESSTPPRSSGFEGCNSESMKSVSGMGDGPHSSSSLLSGNSFWSSSVVNSANVLEGGIGVHRSLSEGHFSVFQDVSATFDAAWTGKGQTQDDMRLIVKEDGSSEAIAVSEASLNEWRKQASPETSDEGSLELRAGNLRPASTLTSPAKAGEPSNIEGWVGAPYLSFSRRYDESQKASQMLSTLPVASFAEQAVTQEVAVSLSPGVDEPVVSVYDDEPTSVIAYAITSQEHQLHLFDKSDKQRDKEKDFKEKDREKMLPVSSGSGTYHPSQSLDGRSDKGNSKESSFSSSHDLLPDDPLLDSKACHVKVNFTDDTPQGKIKYAVTCYYAKQFDCLRKKCCRNELDFIRSLCRCKKWGAQGGKSNVFFAKTADDRFVVKQVTRTELDSFITFAPAYFKHMSDALITGSPTCLAKILGIYQVTVKHVKGGKELRMDLMIMENLLYGRRVTRVYDLKGSLRSRYNADANAKDAVLLDQNLLESLQSNPIFISNKAKRLLERAVWNDTAFLALVDVMDYSLLVGVDEERGDLVLGIIDFMRQYTWDKHLETWVKASGILGGPKNAPPTVISPMQYKKRFRKAMSTYFLMVPDQWLSHSVISSLPCHDDIDDSFLAALGDQSSFDHDMGRV